MSMRQPSPGAQRIISKLVVNLIDGPEVPIQRAEADVSFEATDGPLGVARPDGSMVFDESVGRALERAAEPGRLSDQEVADFRRAIQVVAFTALNKRVEGAEIVLDAEDEADQFVNVGMREAYWAVHGQRIAYNLSPELGGRLLDGNDIPDHPAGREASLALAHQYAKAYHELPDNAVRALLKVPREQIFDKVVDAAMASHLGDRYDAVREPLAELRGTLASDLRTGFEALSRESAGGNRELPDIPERVATLYARVDESARTVKETMTAVGLPQTGERHAATARQHASSTGQTRNQTGFGVRGGLGHGG
jgi:hypothetical protein